MSTPTKDRHPVVEFLLAGTATSCACVLSNPMEVVKTRMQLQGELQSSHAAAREYRHAFHAFYKICSQEGLRGIQGGLVPGIWYQVAMNGTRLSMFGPVQKLLGADPQHSTPLSFFFKNVLAGAICGGCGASVASPFFLIKARLQSQSQGHVRPGAQRFAYRGMVDGLKLVYQAGGVRGLWTGWSGGVLRASVGSSAQLSSYSSCKRLVLSTGWFKDDVWCYFASSLVAGLVVTTAMNPFDVVSTRLYSQSTKMYTGPLDCFAKTFRAEGIPGLFKGWVAHYFRLGPHTIYTFLFWEEIKKLADKFGI